MSCAIAVGSVALAGFGVDSLIEIAASLVVVWQLLGADARRERRALRMIAAAFVLLAIYIAAQSAVTLTSQSRPGHSTIAIIWLIATIATMLVLAAGKRQTGRELDNIVLQTEARVTVVDAALAGAVLAGVTLDTALGWWWADPIAALSILVYGLREARHAWAQAAHT